MSENKELTPSEKIQILLKAVNEIRDSLNEVIDYLDDTAIEIDNR
jgi:hypothetical protein